MLQLQKTEKNKILYSLVLNKFEERICKNFHSRTLLTPYKKISAKIELNIKLLIILALKYNKKRG